MKIIGVQRHLKNSVAPVTIGWPDLHYNAVDCVTLKPGLLCLVIGVIKKRKIIRLVTPDGQPLYTALNEVTLA